MFNFFAVSDVLRILFDNLLDTFLPSLIPNKIKYGFDIEGHLPYISCKICKPLSLQIFNI